MRKKGEMRTGLGEKDILNWSEEEAKLILENVKNI